MVTSASAALSDLRYSFSAGTLTVDSMSFVEKLKKAKLFIQSKFHVAISFKKTRTTLKNGSEETYCEILSSVLRCDHISMDTFREHMTIGRMPKASGKFAASWNPRPRLQAQTPVEPEWPTSASRRVITLECDEETSPVCDFPLPPPLKVPVPEERAPPVVEGELVTDEWGRFDTERVRVEPPAVQRRTAASIPVPVLESQSGYEPSEWRGSEAAEATSYGMYYGFRPIVDVPVRTGAVPVPATFKPLKIETAAPNETDDRGRVGQQAIPVEKFAVFSPGAAIGVTVTFSDDHLKDLEHRPGRDGESQPAREPVRSVSLDFGTSRDGRQGVIVKDKVVTVNGEKGDTLLKQRILRVLDIPCDTPVRALVFT